MGNYFSYFNQQINTSIKNNTIDKVNKFNRFKNESLYSNNIKYNLYIPSLPPIKE